MASDGRALELLSLGERLYTEKKQLDSLCQEIAWQFCPDLASFTTKLILGQDFAIDRMDSYPEQMSRELSNQLSAMLRRSDQPWFRVTTLNDEIDSDEDNARYLEYVGRVVRQGIYDPRSKFIRATKMADRFFVNFGQAVISVEEAPELATIFTSAPFTSRTALGSKTSWAMSTTCTERNKLPRARWCNCSRRTASTRT